MIAEHVIAMNKKVRDFFDQVIRADEEIKQVRFICVKFAVSGGGVIYHVQIIMFQ